MPKQFHSTLILVVVFCLGLGAGIAGMVWAWPGLRSRLVPHRRQTFAQYLQRTLKLTPAQVPQVQAVIKDTGQRRHQIHLQFVPVYTKICEEFMQASEQERASFAPVRQQELDKLQSIMTSSQWQAFQQERTAANRRPTTRRPDLCQHVPSAPAPAHPAGH